MGINADILHALNDRLAAYATANGLDVAWENVKFDPPEGEVWLRPTLLPVRSEPLTLGPNGLMDYPGIYQISVFGPSGKSTGAVYAHVDGVLGHFQRGTSMTEGSATVRIDRVYQGPAIAEDRWFHVPASIEFFCFAANG